MIQNLEKCNICPHECNCNRYEGKIGRCKATDKIRIALYSIHDFEEPCISGKKGSGTIFFSNCNLNCVYCQNYEISQLGKGKDITIEELSDIFLYQQEKGVENVNLVTPTSYTIQIIEAIKIARRKGFKLPIIYNTNGYEKVETLKLLEGYIDVYLPDLKYAENELAFKYSKIDNYFEIATKAILEMIRQVGVPKFNTNGIIEKGVIVRHLVLPNLVNDSKQIINYLFNTYHNNIYISIMNQYTPLEHVKKYKDLNRMITNKEYDEVINYAIELGIENAFIQEGETQKESFIPDFDYTGI